MSYQEQAEQQCLEAALGYLGLRPRSERELRRRLKRRGFGQDSIDKALLRLKEQGLVDDVAFARFWKENRESFHPRSRRVLEQELRQKEVAPEIVREVVQEVDEESSAYKVARKRMRTLVVSSYTDFCLRLGAFLRRRGFSYETARTTVNRLWQERNDRDNKESTSG